MRVTPVAPLAARCRRGDGLGRFCDDLAKILRSFRKQTQWRAANVNGEALDDRSKHSGKSEETHPADLRTGPLADSKGQR